MLTLGRAVYLKCLCECNKQVVTNFIQIVFVLILGLLYSKLWSAGGLEKPPFGAEYSMYSNVSAFQTPMGTGTQL